MHHEVLHFIYETKNVHPEYFNNARVLEIGSKTGINSTGKVRSHFKNCDYVGVDVSGGYAVDVVKKGHEYKSDKLFDTVFSCECFEHDPFWYKTIQNMIKHLKPNGLLMFTCASTGRPEHGTLSHHPHASIEGDHHEDFEYDLFKDYYQNLTEQDFKNWVPQFTNGTLKGSYWVSNEGSKDLYYKGWKS